MKRELFLNSTIIVLLALMTLSSTELFAERAKKKQIYEWRIYTVTDKASLDGYFTDVLIPTYNSYGVKVGAFALAKPHDEVVQHYMFVYPDMATYTKVKSTLWKNAKFLTASQDYYNRTANTPDYKTYQSYLAEAFGGFEALRAPIKDRGIFEFRVYQSPNEEANQRKIKMFMNGEVEIFDSVGIHSVLYGEVFAGPVSPAIFYLTCYQNNESRDAAWKGFGAHPDWKSLSKDPQYSKTATRNTSTLLIPLNYSQY